VFGTGQRLGTGPGPVANKSGASRLSGQQLENGPAHEEGDGGLALSEEDDVEKEREGPSSGGSCQPPRNHWVGSCPKISLGPRN